MAENLHTLAPATSSSRSGETPSRASPSQIQAQFDLAIAIILSNWPALILAVQNQWGGPDSADKRDWLAGAISDLFASQPDTDAAEVEDVLVQVLQDEFGVDLEDESEERVAASILRVREETARGEFGTVRTLHADWVRRKERNRNGDGNGMDQVQIKRQSGGDEDDDDTEDEESDKDESEEDGDVVMGDALAQAKPKPEPEVDEEGFTKVVGRKKR